MSAADRPVLARDDPSGAPGTLAHAGVDPTLEGRALQDALRAAIATRRGYCWWDVDHAGWAVTLSEGIEAISVHGWQHFRITQRRSRDAVPRRDEPTPR